MEYKSVKLFLEELETNGFYYKNIDAIFCQNKIQKDVVHTALVWLPAIYEEHLGSGDHLVRALIGADEPFDPTVLIDLFENSNYNKVIKCSISYVLAIAKTHDITNWFRDQLLLKKSAFERAGLLYGITNKAGITDRDELMGFLQHLFDKYSHFGTYQKLYQKYARLEDVIFLEQKLANPNLTDFVKFVEEADLIFGDNKAKDVPKRFHREISKMVEKIKQRKKEFRFPVIEKK
jgi:hypothetical protein